MNDAEIELSDRCLVAIMAAILFAAGYKDNTPRAAVEYAEEILSIVEGGRDDS